MRTLIFDTETTGFWNFKAQIDDISQPHPVQIAAILYEDRREVAGANILCKALKPSAPGALNVHQKTPELLAACGFEEKTALAIFSQFLKVADRIVAHNADYDSKIIQGAMSRHGNLPEFFTTPLLCTMKSSTSICRIPHANGRPGFKWPKLDEAYRVLVDEKGFADAHDALADTRACAEVLWKLEDAGVDIVEIKK
jgi:DNA polymerase-3 subunit epsilon